MEALQIQLLGGFNLMCDGAPTNALNQPRLQSLLAYLLIHRHTPQPRYHLAFTFWPDANESQAHNNLRQMLYQLRRKLPGASSYLYMDVNVVQWLPDSLFRLDVNEFEKTVDRAVGLDQGDSRAVSEAYRQAIENYGGDLLPSCYDDWITNERERLQQQYQKSLRRLIQVLEGLREYASALEYAQQLIQLDPLNEDFCLCLMRLHAFNNDRAGAIQVYHDCVANLARELDIGPCEKLRTAYRHLLNPDSYLSDC